LNNAPKSLILNHINPETQKHMQRENQSLPSTIAMTQILPLLCIALKVTSNLRKAHVTRDSSGWEHGSKRRSGKQTRQVSRV